MYVFCCYSPYVANYHGVCVDRALRLHAKFADITVVNYEAGALLKKTIYQPASNEQNQSLNNFAND